MHKLVKQTIKFLYSSAWFLFPFFLGFLLTSGLVTIFKNSTNFDIAKSSRDSRAAILSSFKNNHIGRLSFLGFKPSVVGNSLDINLDDRKILFYESGRLSKIINILKLADDDSPWQPLVGKYSVVDKEPIHKSLLSNIEVPYTISWGGNAYIHAPITDPKGNRIVSVEVSLQDARYLFDVINKKDSISIDQEGSLIDRYDKNSPIFGFKNPEFKLANSGKTKITARSYLVVDLDTDQILLSNNPDKVLPIASISKLLTGLVAKDDISPSSRIRISNRSVLTYGRQGRLLAGDVFLAEDLFYPLLLESSNDAAEAFAESIDRDKFMLAINQKAKEIGMRNTYLEDPSGLSPANVSTSADLYKLIKHLYKSNSQIFELTKIKEYRTKELGVSGRTLIWKNANRFVNKGDQRFAGGKDGYTWEAGLTFAGVFRIPVSEFKNKELAVILLDSLNRQNDLNNIINKITKGLVYSEGPTLEQVNRQRQSKKGISEQDIEEEKLSLLFVGDIMLDRGVKQSIYQNGKGDYGFSFQKTFFLENADIAFANLEGPVSNVGYDLGNTYSFRMEPQALLAIKQSGLDVLSIANNHIGDWGMSAFEDSIDRITNAGILPVGGDRNYIRAKEPKIIEKKGKKIGFLAFSDVGPSWLAKNPDLPTVLLANDPNIESIIKEASREVDYLVVSFHFGEEYQLEPSKRQKYLAHLAIDSGAKIVVGHHPHVVQEIERYKDGIIAYSLGNFIFDQYFSDETMSGAILEIILNKTGIEEANIGLVELNDKYQPVLIE